MTTLVDGPAANVILNLRRSPLFLRVVQNRISKEWDALDQLDDIPKPTETIVAYRLLSNDGCMHLLIRGKYKKAGGWYPVSSYGVVEQQPDDATMRDTEKWRAWCAEENARNPVTVKGK